MDGAQDGPAYDPPKHRRPLTFSRWRSGEWPVIDRYAGQKEKTLTRKIPPPGLLFRTARHWNLRAEEMRSLAEEANDATVRRMMFRIAADYEWLGEKAVDRGIRESVMFKGDVDRDPRGATLVSVAEDSNGP
jgi:hypothetical protein